MKIRNVIIIPVAAAALLGMAASASAAPARPGVLWQAAGEIHPGGRPGECVGAEPVTTDGSPVGAVVMVIDCSSADNYYVNWILVRNSDEGKGVGVGEVELLANPRYCLGFSQPRLFGSPNRTAVIQPCVTEKPSGAVIAYTPFAGQWMLGSWLGYLSASRGDPGTTLTWQMESRKYIQTFTVPGWYREQEPS